MIVYGKNITEKTNDMRKIELKDNANLGGLMSIVAVPPTAVYELSKRKNHATFEYNDARVWISPLGSL